MIGEPYSKGRAQNLVTLLALDPVNGKIVAQLIEPELFEGPLREISSRLVKFWREQKTCPGPAHLFDLFADILDKSDRQARVYRRILQSIGTLGEAINAQYVIDDLRKTSRRQKMKAVLLQAAEIAQQENIDIEEGERLLAEFVRAREFNFEPGLKLSDVDKVIDQLELQASEFTTGIEELDRGHVVPARGTVMLFLAPTRRGKSWFLCNIGKHGLLQRKNVLHVSLEMDAAQTMQRYYQALFSIPKHPTEIDVFDIDRAANGQFDGATSHRIVRRKHTFEHKNIRKYLKMKLRPWIKDRRIHERLRVVRFPTGQLTVAQLRAYIDMLESVDGFTPDLCILDYVGIMATDAKNHRVSLGRVFEDFRGLCIERNMAGVTAQQSSKSGEEAYQVAITHVAEDWSLIATADVALTFSQTPAERARGLARLWVGKARGEADEWGVVLSQSYALGQFALQSARLGKPYHEYIADLTRRESRNRTADDDDDE